MNINHKSEIIHFVGSRNRNERFSSNNERFRFSNSRDKSLNKNVERLKNKIKFFQVMLHQILKQQFWSYRQQLIITT